MKLIFAVLDVSLTMGLTRCYKTRFFYIYLLLMTNRKSHTGFRLVLISMILNDLERRNSPYIAFFNRIR